MQSVFNRTQAVILASVVLMFVLGLMAPIAVHAQPVPDPLKPNPIPANLPQYNAGVDKSIEQYLCTPTGQGTDLADCIKKLQTFGITAGAVVLVFMVVIAGYIYITTGEAGKGKAKGIVLSSVTGMAILLGSYALLNFINPELLKIKPIQPPIFSALKLPTCEAIGFGAKCIASDGSVFNPGGSVVGGTGNMKQWVSQINANASGIDPCALYALVELESGGNHLIVSNGPPGRVDPNHSDKKFYGLPFTRAAKGSSLRGHGIGLGQIYIYGPPPNGSDGDRWAEANYPSRPGAGFGFSKALTITDLIDPNTNLKAAAHHFKQKLGGSNDYAAGYAKYHGAATINGINVKEIYQSKYIKCKQG